MDPNKLCVAFQGYQEHLKISEFSDGGFVVRGGPFMLNKLLSCVKACMDVEEPPALPPERLGRRKIFDVAKPVHAKRPYFFWIDEELQVHLPLTIKNSIL